MADRPSHFRVTRGGITLEGHFVKADSIVEIDALGKGVDFLTETGAIVEASEAEVKSAADADKIVSAKTVSDLVAAEKKRFEDANAKQPGPSSRPVVTAEEKPTTMKVK